MRAPLSRVRRSFLALFVAATTAAVATCGGDPVTPSNPPPPVETVNTPPVITSVAVANPRIEANDQVQLTASVTDAETPVDSLTYQWSASIVGGTFTGTGRQVQWKAPAGAKTPDTVTFTLTVVENYTSLGQPKQNQVSATASAHYNDSTKEVGDLALQFLTDFSTNDVSPAQCVRNFSDSCPGKFAEQGDVENERRLFTILGGDLKVLFVNVDAARTSATTDVDCVFYDIPKTGPRAGIRERVPGICTLTAVYESFKWFLCTSTWRPNGTVTNYDYLQYRVPGRITAMPLLRPTPE